MPEGTSREMFKVSTGPLPASRKVHVPGQRLSRPPRRDARDRSDRRRRRSRRCASMIPPAPIPIPPRRSTFAPGLPPLRDAWIRARGDVEEIAGRNVRPEDNGLKAGEESDGPEVRPQPPARRCAPSTARSVTQLAYARAGIITQEMEYIAIRENLGRARAKIAVARRQVASAPRSPTTSRRNSCATKSRAAAPSSRPTSTIPKPSR